MASQEWRPLRASRLLKVVCAVGLAIGCTTLLFLCLGRAAPALSASTDSDVDRTIAWAEVGEIGPTWTSTQPWYTVVGPDGDEWPITEHRVTVTFPENAVSEPAWFTFTPRLSRSLGSGYAPTPYFFDLEGVYMENDLEVSFAHGHRIDVAISYDPSRLIDVDERTLQFFHRATSGEWVPQGGDLDLVAKTITLHTPRTESFAVGGEALKIYLYLPNVMRE
jgi:hypothetical protein